LKAAKEKTKSKIYAYCFMTNHLHLLLEPCSKDGIGDMLQSLGRRYVRYINQTYKRTGTLWEGRFKSSLVSKDEYLLACARYIELNPVRAKIVNHPQDYPWPSFGFRAEGRPDELLDEDPLYKGLGKTPRERQTNYKEWLKRSIGSFVNSKYSVNTYRSTSNVSKNTITYQGYPTMKGRLYRIFTVNNLIVFV
jgi:putative transposase